jgi:hypothetical protein
MDRDVQSHTRNKSLGWNSFLLAGFDWMGRSLASDRAGPAVRAASLTVTISTERNHYHLIEIVDMGAWDAYIAV